jgi:peptidyl-prolyl cis-trans isomerase C
VKKILKKALRKIVSEPLTQFLAMGVLIVVLVEIFIPAESVSQPFDIHVDEATMVNFLQYRKKSFDTVAATSAWQLMSAESKASLVEDYVRDEVLYRESMAMGLDENDQIIRRRMIQKLDYVTRGFIDQKNALSEAEINSYFNANQSDYTVDASVTFSHVFIKKKSENMTRANVEANELLRLLNTNSVTFEDAAQYGDRFLFHRNYVDRTPEFVANHFGENFSEKVFAQVAGKQWLGPINSKYGAHLVSVSENTPSRTPALAEVAAIVVEDLRRLKMDTERKQAVETMIAKYSVRSSLGSLDSVRSSAGSYTGDLVYAQ